MLLLAALGGAPRAAAVVVAGGEQYDAGATEIERILNIERVQAGLAALPIDTFLAAKARDGAVACPNDPSLVMEGRAKDLAVNGYVGTDPHYLRLCPTKSIGDAMWAWGYHGAVGEIIAWNAGYSGSDPFWYRSDCGNPGYPACEFLTYSAVSVAATGWQESSGHRAVVVGAYDQFGCGAWIAPDGAAQPGGHYFVCMYAMGGPNPTVPAPTVVPLFPPRAPAKVDAGAAWDAAAFVSWEASVGLMASPVSAYTVTASPGGRTCATTGALECLVTGLAAGTPYTFTVRATNGDGNGPPSVASNAVTVTTRLGKVTRLAAPTEYPAYANNRYGTAASVSKATFNPGVPVAYIATGSNFPDALAGAAAAGHLGGPVLLVGATIPAVTAAELDRLRPARIVVLGGTGAVSDAVMGMLGTYTAGKVTRLAAPTEYPAYANNRYGTAASVSKATFNPGVPVAYIATGSNFPDALAGAAAAGHLGGPVLLVGATIPAVTAAELDRLRPARIVVLGGTGAVSDAVMGMLGTYTAGKVTRLAAPTEYPAYANNRYGTAASVSKATFNPGVPVAYIATGSNFPDALAGAAAAGHLGGPVLLVGATIPAVTAAELDRLRPARSSSWVARAPCPTPSWGCWGRTWHRRRNLGRALSKLRSWSHASARDA